MVDARTQQMTVELTQCVACGYGLFDRHKFCRWCGADQDQTNSAVRANTASGPVLATTRLVASTDIAPAGARPTGDGHSSAPRATGAMTDGRLYHRASGPLVRALTANLSSTSGKLHNRIILNTVMALISLPVWLMIVLLSPLDAYQASKALVNQAEGSTI